MELELDYTDFNEMPYNKICKIPGIGKTTANRIVAMRPFRSNDDLFKIKGLGKSTLKKLGIEKTKKQRKSWLLHPTLGDGIEYPHYCFAHDTLTGKLDFFWRIPRERRKYYEPQ